MNDLTPPAWAGTVAQQLVRTSVGFIRRDAAGNLPTRPVDTPRAQEWLDAREAFLLEWTHMTEHGLDEGFLEHDTCFECPGAIEATTDTVVRTYEPNPDYIAPPIPSEFRIPRA